MGSTDQSKMENGPKDLGRQIDWNKIISEKFWVPQYLSIVSIKELRWALENPQIWANK